MTSGSKGDLLARERGVAGLELDVSDAELVSRARAGERWASEAIFRRYVGIVGGFATRLLARRDEADDVVQETFIDALTSLARLTDGSGLKPWLLSIAMNRVRRRFRRRSLLRRLGLDRALPDAQLADLAAPDTSPETIAELRRIDTLLSRLSEKNRMAWMLRHVEGESLEDVARLCGCSLATAKRRIATAQERLDAAFARGVGP